jgi:ornithine carbamoyltransferase
MTRSTFKRSVLKGYATNGVVRSTTNTGICYGFDQTLDFPKEQFIRTTVPQAVATVQKATIMVKDPGPETPVVKGDNIGTIMWVVMGAGAFLLLFF